MASYSLVIKRSAERDIENLPARSRRRVVGRITTLAQDPRPFGSEKLSGEEKYRLRQGDYRVVYGIDDARTTVIIERVGHRRDVYR